MSSTAPIVNGGSSKAPDSDVGGTTVGFTPQTKMVVQPPKKEDLQRSYASVVETDANPKGWYGSMSRSPNIHSHVALSQEDVHAILQKSF